MADTFRGRVTITLGRTGQVVKKSGTVSDGFTDNLPSSASKRSVRERLGSNSDRSLVNTSQLSRKRQRGDIDLPTRNGSGLDDVRIGKDDLRYMLLQKNSGRRTDNHDERVADLREKLVKTVHPSATVLDTRQRPPERRENGVSSQIRLPPSRGEEDDLLRLDSSRNSYSPWSLEHLRRRSPERYISSSRGPSPRRNVEDFHSRRNMEEFHSKRNIEELPRTLVMRTPGDVRPVPYTRRDVIEPPRPISSAPYLSNSARPTSIMRPPAPQLVGLNPPPGPGISVQRSTQLVIEHQTVDSLLNALELGKYSIIFKAEEVDMAALKQMGEHDLKELGIPMGPRKKILQSIQPRPKRQQ